MWYALIAMAILVLVGLSYYAGQLLWKLKQQESLKAQEKNKRIEYITDSIHHIAKAMKEEQCEYSEGVLRIWVLLEHYNSEISVPKDYGALYLGFANLYQVIKDMPTHDARKKLNKQERFKMDVKRWDAEKDNKEQINADLDGIIAEFSK